LATCQTLCLSIKTREYFLKGQDIQWISELCMFFKLSSLLHREQIGPEVDLFVLQPQLFP